MNTLNVGFNFTFFTILHCQYNFVKSIYYVIYKTENYFAGLMLQCSFHTHRMPFPRNLCRLAAFGSHEHVKCFLGIVWMYLIRSFMFILSIDVPSGTQPFDIYMTTSRNRKRKRTCISRHGETRSLFPTATRDEVIRDSWNLRFLAFLRRQRHGACRK